MKIGTRKMDLRHLTYNESKTTRAQHIVHVLRNDVEREPPRIQRPLIIFQKLPPQQPIAAGLMNETACSTKQT